ncbi:hypothetical protein H6P81_020061 [Aristolochia fimbriata]|uniref:Uncharacterized protein n=1 Tax=Aristolochia fimbriata TaxID=158543 RepID=A0AAV7DUL5_ARIFI|nr:hypothetical protein H6P81_020061 [Aristolochia fimbriata]
MAPLQSLLPLGSPPQLPSPIQFPSPPSPPNSPPKSPPDTPYRLPPQDPSGSPSPDPSTPLIPRDPLRLLSPLGIGTEERPNFLGGNRILSRWEFVLPLLYERLRFCLVIPSSSFWTLFC